MASALNNGEMKSEKWEEVFSEFKKIYEDAYFSIDKAIKLDEESKINEALPLYEFGLNLIEAALEIPIKEPNQPDLSWEKALAMTQKLKKTRKEIIMRIENIKSQPYPTATELPPSYEDAVGGSKPAHTDNTSTNFQLPGTSKVNAPYIPPSALYDHELLANLQINVEETTKHSVTYSDLSQQLKEIKLAKDEEILFRCHNVQLYFIAPDGRVSATPGTDTLIIARVHDVTCNVLDEALIRIVTDINREISHRKKKKSRVHHHHHHRHHLHRRGHRHREKKHITDQKDETQDQSYRTFLQVGSWVYPLIPEVSPCIRSEYGAFILPDINSDIEGAAVGIILPAEVTEEVHELFTHLLNEITATGRSRRSVLTDSTSDKFSSKIVRGATYLAHNLVRGAGSTARFLDTSTPKLIDRITPQNKPQMINPTIQKTVEVAKTVSGKAVDVTDYLATKISLATSALGRYLSPHIQKQGTRLLASTTSMSEEEASQKINTMLSFTSDAVEGISTVYCGLDTAATILARSLANNTVQIIEYKYGQPAGALTNDAFTTFGNVYYTKHNFRVFNPKGIARAAVKGAGNAILEDFKQDRHSKPHDEFPGSGPGAGTGFLPRA